MKLKISIVSSSCIPNSFQLHPQTLPPLLTFAGIVSWWPVFFRLLGYTSMEIMLILKVKWTSQCQITSGPCLNCSTALFLFQMDRLDPVGGLDFKLPKKHTETCRNTQKHTETHRLSSHKFSYLCLLYVSEGLRYLQSAAVSRHTSQAADPLEDNCRDAYCCTQ